MTANTVSYRIFTQALKTSGRKCYQRIILVIKDIRVYKITVKKQSDLQGTIKSLISII